MKKNTLKTIIFALVVLALGLFTVSAALAYGPYDGVNRIGTYYQQVSYGSYGYSYATSVGGTSYYGGAIRGNQYPIAPRTGGWFGNGVEYLTGLRPGVYIPQAPVGYSVHAYPTCNWPNCYLGGAGYPTPSASGGFYRTRMGGAYV